MGALSASPSLMSVALPAARRHWLPFKKADPMATFFLVCTTTSLFPRHLVSSRLLWQTKTCAKTDLLAFRTVRQLADRATNRPSLWGFHARLVSMALTLWFVSAQINKTQ